jgi:hypothetical protein
VGSQDKSIGAAPTRPNCSSASLKAENRREIRHPARLRSGHIADGPRGFICDCVIRNHSAKGARLLLPPNVSLPRCVWFYDDDLKKAVRAEVRWQKGQEVGILKFL